MIEPPVIAIVTGSRAESGLLRPVMAAVAERGELELAVIVAGQHLVAGTWRDVKAAGFAIDARVPMQRHDLPPGRAADAMAVGKGVGGFVRAFERVRVDVVVVLGDRIEAYAAATAASIGGWPLAHIHGGDRAEGVADEAMRHAITKLAHVHFPATAQSARRILGMGEPKQAVHVVGSPAVDGLTDIQPDADAPEALILQHPVGASADEEQGWMQQTLAATRGRSRLVIGPNGDAGSDGIRRAIGAEQARHETACIEHLPRRRWLQLLAGTQVIVGNSSAALIEAAVLRTPAVNIGPRQAGRERARNVIDCDYGRRAVQAAMAEASRLDLRRLRHPYGRPGAGRRIADHLATLNLNPDALPLRKHNTY